MASKAYLRAVIEVKQMAESGFKLSELTGLKLAVAKRLIDRGQLHAFPIGHGDMVVNKS